MVRIDKRKWMLLLLASLILILSTGCSQNKNVESKASVQPEREFRPVSSGKFRSVALADLDNDGHIDVVAGGLPPKSLSINYGDGLGRLSEPQFLPVQGEVQSVAAADTNGDGFKDIILSVQKGSTGIKVWQYQGIRKWIRVPGPTAINQFQGIVTADVNRDGHMDIIAANATPGNVAGIQVWLGDGRGNWPVESGPTKAGQYMDVAVADFNEDGVLDLVGTGWGVHGSLRVWLGDGSGNWSALKVLSSGSFYGVNAGDLNRDGHMDIMAGTYRAGIQVFFGNGDGRFTRGRQPQATGSFWDVITTDLESDGITDLLATSNVSGGIRAWKYIDQKSWQFIPGRFPALGTYYQMALADLNGDGSEDICAASFGEGVKFWHGKSQVPFTSISESIIRSAAADTEVATSAIEENDAYTSISGIPEYKIGPGDVLEITLWQGREAKREQVLVRPDGNISFGFLDDLQVKGLTPTQLDKLLTESHKKYVKHPRIDVVVKEYNSKFVAITGAIGTGIRTSEAGIGSGRYPLTGKVRLLEMVARAGGPARDANLRDVKLRRKDGQALTLNLFRVIYQGDGSQDIILNPGDYIFFPTLIIDANRVYVFGEVANPGVYKLPETNMRLFDAISEAGGPTVFGERRSAKIVRGDPTHPEIIEVDLKRLIEQGDQTQNVLLVSGDLIYVPRSAFGDVNVFWQRVKPLFEMVIAPARIVNEWDDALDTLGK
jgi:protein involved in polysaccharide export with SLBB domain